MTIEVHPIGLRCNLACTYCYQENMRPADSPVLNIKKMLREIKRNGSDFTVFGGEPLLTPYKTLRLLFMCGHKYYGKNGIQTNGTILSSDLIDLFKKYNVHVGVSIDGPDSLNDERELRGSAAATRVSTWKTMGNILTLLNAGVGVSIILTLHAQNARGERLERLARWLEFLVTKGLRSVRTHLLELDNPEKTRRLVLTAEENANAVRRIASIPQLDVDLYGEMERNLLQDLSNSSCVWHGCDPYTTPAVVGIDADGSLSNCGRVNKNGVNYRKADTPGRERVVALYNTPYSDGGCQGCRFFLACKGQCPGTGIGGDWRNRTEHCDTLLLIFGEIERALVAEGKLPVSLNPERERLEREYLKESTVGSHGDAHEDWHTDIPHQDVWYVPVGKENA